jgi:cytochrome c-type biogenesis protein CcmF
MAFQLAALLRVDKNGSPKKSITTEKVGYIQQDQPITEVGIQSSFFEDLYVILSDVPDIAGAVQNRPDAQRATFTFMIKPLVGWIWYGGMIVALGGLIALWPGAGAPVRTPVPARRRAVAPVAAAAAGD